MVSVAAARSSDRRQHRRRLSALQQIIQLFLRGARSLMRDLLFRAALGSPLTETAPAVSDEGLVELARNVHVAAHERLGRSLSIRQIDSGSCNGCELEIHALNNPYYDLER